jgi:hypothetical protein
MPKTTGFNAEIRVLGHGYSHQIYLVVGVHHEQARPSSFAQLPHKSSRRSPFVEPGFIFRPPGLFLASNV